MWATTLSLTIGVLAACNKSEPPPRTAPAAPQAAASTAPAPDVAFRVTRIDLGTAVGADKKITAPTVIFERYDTIYASILTEGSAPNIALRVRWTFGDREGQLVNEATQMISPTGPAATEFHIAKQEGWAAGKYKIEVRADGQPARTLEYTVTEAAAPRG